MNVIDCRHVRCKRKRNTDIALACLEERAQLISCHVSWADIALSFEQQAISIAVIIIRICLIRLSLFITDAKVTDKRESKIPIFARFLPISQIIAYFAQIFYLYGHYEEYPAGLRS